MALLVTPEGVLSTLPRLVEHGARAGRLLRAAPDLVLWLASTDDQQAPTLNMAVRAEQLIRRAIAQFDPNVADALRILLQLETGYLGSPLQRRRADAGARLDPVVLGDTFRREKHEQRYLTDLAVEIYYVIDAAGRPSWVKPLSALNRVRPGG